MHFHSNPKKRGKRVQSAAVVAWITMLIVALLSISACSKINEQLSSLFMSEDEGAYVIPKHLVSAPPLRPETKRKRPVQSEKAIDYVVMVTVDGMATRLIKHMIEQNMLPTFRRIQKQGSWTYQARTDYLHTNTMTNHLCMITGLPTTHVKGTPKTAFHGYTSNVMPPEGVTLHNSGNPALTYMPSIFDVAHDLGLKTCLFSGKEKFIVISRSYDQHHGAADKVGEDDGRNKIDLVVLDEDLNRLVVRFLKEQETLPCNLTLLHLKEPDHVGHKSGWGSEAWQRSMRNVDLQIAKILDQIELRTELRTRTALLVTADHGGIGLNHTPPDRSENYTIPFFMWSPNTPLGVDLYNVFTKTRKRPGANNPSYLDYPQPIRNCDIGNHSLQLLGLPAVPGSIIGM